MLPDSPGEMRALVGPDFPVESVVAVAVADRVDNASRTVAGQRVVLSPNGVRALSIPSLRVVLRHEITHLAARADTVDGSPTWLLEGFADYVGYRDSGVTLAEGAPDLAKQVRDEGPPTSLPEDRAFRSSGSDLDLAYQQSWSLARFVAERYGEDTLVELYRTLAAVGPASAQKTDDLLREVLGMDRARARGGLAGLPAGGAQVGFAGASDLGGDQRLPAPPRRDPVLSARARDPAAGPGPGRLRAVVGAPRLAPEFDAEQPFPVIRHDGGLMLPTPAVARRAREILRAEQCDTVWFGAAAPLALLAPRCGRPARGG